MPVQPAEVLVSTIRAGVRCEAQPMAAPLSGTVVPSSQQSEGSSNGDRPPPSGTTELADAVASSGDAVASIAPLAPVMGDVRPT